MRIKKRSQKKPEARRPRLFLLVGGCLAIGLVLLLVWMGPRSSKKGGEVRVALPKKVIATDEPLTTIHFKFYDALPAAKSNENAAGPFVVKHFSRDKNEVQLMSEKELEADLSTRIKHPQPFERKS